jgi:hypothetical protein
VNLEVLVEELSAETALDHLLPKILGPGVPFAIRVFQGKTDLLAKLPNRLAGYSNWIRDTDTRIVVLVDRDDDDCIELKKRLEAMARDAGFVTPSTAGDESTPCLLLRIAVEELEAWFLGDVPAICTAYPRVPRSLGDRAGFRDPDAVAGTWEALERVLKRQGYQVTGLRKVETAHAVASVMDPEHNRSASFVAFRDGLRRLVGSL